MNTSKVKTKKQKSIEELFREVLQHKKIRWDTSKTQPKSSRPKRKRVRKPPLTPEEIAAGRAAICQETNEQIKQILTKRFNADFETAMKFAPRINELDKDYANDLNAARWAVEQMLETKDAIEEARRKTLHEDDWGDDPDEELLDIIDCTVDEFCNFFEIESQFPPAIAISYGIMFCHSEGIYNSTEFRPHSTNSSHPKKWLKRAKPFFDFGIWKPKQTKEDQQMIF